MLKIFNDLKPFFENNYRRINVREYARIMNISPPSASKLLSELKNEGLIIREEEKNYIYYFANKENKQFIEFSRIYWNIILEKIGLIEYLKKELINPLIILFGSFSKAEVKDDSDIDLVIFTISKKSIDLKIFEKKINRKIQLFMFKSEKDVKNKDLFKNILNGYTISGNW